MLGVLAGVVLGNGVHRAGGMTAMTIKHAASSRMPASIGGGTASCPGRRHLHPRGHCGGTLNFLVCAAEMIDGLLLG